MPCVLAFDSGKATFPTTACRGARGGETRTGVRFGQAAGPSSPGRGEQLIFKLGGWEEALLLPPVQFLFICPPFN